MPLLFAQLTVVPSLTRQMHLQVRATFPMSSVFTVGFLCILYLLGVSYAFCLNWEITPVCSQLWWCLRRCAEPMSALQNAWQEAHLQLIMISCQRFAAHKL